MKWSYRKLKRQNEESLATLVQARPDFTADDARFFVALCRSGSRTPHWLVDKMVGAEQSPAADALDGALTTEEEK